MNQFSRTAMLLPDHSMQRLQNASVAVFGVGGVGGYVVEALARSGIGTLAVYDNDTVSLTNLNRQIIALHSTVGRPKVDVIRERILDINPDCRVEAFPVFYMPENAGSYDLSSYDYVVDAIDTVSAKLELAQRCSQLHIPVISAMGAGNKLDPSMIRISDISETHTCPLARVMRVECRKRGIAHLKAAWSAEPALTPSPADEDVPAGKRSIPGSNAWVPSAMGLMIAGEVIRDLIAASHNETEAH